MSEVSNREATTSLHTGLMAAIGPRSPIAKVTCLEIIGILETAKPELDGQPAVERTSEGCELPAIANSPPYSRMVAKWVTWVM